MVYRAHVLRRCSGREGLGHFRWGQESNSRIGYADTHHYRREFSLSRYPQVLIISSRRVGVYLIIALVLPVFLSAQNTKNVLVLHAGSANQPAHLLVSKVFRDMFGADTHNQLFEEFLDADRLRLDDKTLAEIGRASCRE